jgi:hypothetical protein
MAKVKVAGVGEFAIEDSGGTERNLENYIDTIDAMGKEGSTLDVSNFGDSAERFIAGIQLSQEFTIAGHYDDTATSGPDVVLAAIAGGTAGTFTYEPAGTSSGRRRITGTAFCTSYKIVAAVKERVSYEAVFKTDGAVTLAVI